MSNFVERWKGIAALVGRSERWCRYMALRKDDPLPVFKVGGIVRMRTSDLDAWIDRQAERPKDVASGWQRPAPRKRAS